VLFFGVFLDGAGRYVTAVEVLYRGNRDTPGQHQEHECGGSDTGSIHGYID
jgi:hypothetical protein